MSSKLWRVLLLTVFVLSMMPVGLAGAEECTGPSVTPTVIPGNPKICNDDYKIDSGDLVYGEPFSTTWTVDGEEVTVWVEIYDTDDGEEFKFWVVGGVAYQVLVKGGPMANLYDYGEDGTDGDCGLSAPLNTKSGDWYDISHISFCLEPGGDTPGLGLLAGAKWYDLNMDGVWDDDEAGLEGWLIKLYKYDADLDDYVFVAQTLTDAFGGYEFIDLEYGEYKIAEGPVSGNWVQTWPVDPNFYVGIEISMAVPAIYELDFGNVCVRDAMGYTMGFWSNKNGAAALKAAGYSASDIKYWQDFFKKANAEDMCVMLAAQYQAHYFNTTVPVNGKVADYSGAGVIIDGVVWDYDAVMADFAAFNCGEASRCEAEWFKDFFDGLNNNWFGLVELEPCDPPVWD
jgi:hypothetical protein